MKITEVTALPISVGGNYAALANPYEWAVIVVLIKTDEGLTGIGEASLAGQGRGVLGILDHFGEMLIGQDPARIEHWWSEMVRGTFWSNGQVIMSAAAGIDMALWISRAKRLACRSGASSEGPRRSEEHTSELQSH